MIAKGSELQALIRRLESHSEVTLPDRVLLDSLRPDVRTVTTPRSMAWFGDSPEHVTLVLSGWCCSYKLLGDGRRQVVGYHLPGEIPDLAGMDLDVLDFSLTNVGPCVYATLPHDAVRDLVESNAGIDRLLRREAHVQGALTRAWLGNVGRRPGLERLAHFLCETHDRLAAIGLGRGDRMRLPMTQCDLADALGMTPVHVNRVSQELRSLGLLDWRRNEVTLLDKANLVELSDYDSVHLHLRQPAPARKRPVPAERSQEQNHLRLVVC